MHQNTVQVTSLRLDGSAFRCTIPDEGEVWMTIPENMRGHVEYKATYNIGWTKNPRKTGGFFYNLKQLQLASAAPPASMPGPVRHNNPPPTTSNGHGIDRELRIAALAYANHLGPILAAQSDNFTGAKYESFARHLHFKSLIAVHEGEADYLKWLAGKDQNYVENIEDTF